MSYLDTTARPLTITKSNTNMAHSIWYKKLTPVQRLDVAKNISCKLSGLDKLNACLNYVEDNLEQFTN